jgi:inositol-1,4,5-trisphosphate 5-phosphatase
MYLDLLHNDQLNFEMKIGRIKGFYEGKIRFAPTYKRKPKNNNELSFKRNPAWTDRILYKYNENECLLIQKSYDSNNQVTLSDHRPVFS